MSNFSLIDFFKERGVDYLKHLAFSDAKLKAEIERKCKRALKKGMVERERLWLGSYYAKELEGELYPPFEIRWCGDEVGYGVFPAADLKKHAFVAEYTGIVRRKRLFFHKCSDYCFGYETHLGWRGYVIDAEKGGNLARFVNHSETPNVETVGVFLNGWLRIVLRTTRDVRKGEQLAYDYGTDYWRKRRDQVTLSP